MKKNTWLIVSIFTVLIAMVWGLTGAPTNAQGAWYAEYFTNRDLAGGPALTRYEEDLRFEWGGGSPGSGIPNDNFSARWTREEWFEAGTYRFSYRSDDGVRIWVGDTLVVDDWHDRQATWSFVDRYIPRGTHRVRVEYYEHGGGAALQLTWDRVSGGDAWRGEYFNNYNLSGSPELVRYDPAVDFDWGDGSPDEEISADYFSVRWTRTLGFTPGTYRFYASCDDGVRITVDGKRVVDAWQDQQLPNTHTGDLTLSEGQHTIVVEYYEHGGQASAHVWWNRLGTFSNWEGRYYDNAELRGGPALIRDDTEINFDWGEGGPADWMPSDNFSVTWSRKVHFDPGYYRFNVQSDDGVRVWLDGGLMMDFWEPMDYEYHYVDGVYLEGIHEIKVEYFERAGGARIHFWWTPSGEAPAAPAPTPTQAPTSEPAPQLPGPWQAEYFDNTDLSGDPVLTRQDQAIDFSWGWGSPDPRLGRDDFSARWIGSFSFPAGRYRFTTTTDDGVRLYVDGRLIIDAWRPMRGTRVGYATLSAAVHEVRVEYFERSQAARAYVDLQRIGTAPAPTPTPTPASRTYEPQASGPWEARYYDNPDLAGEPLLTRQDQAIDFNWGWDAPAPSLPTDNFSVEWVQEAELSEGRYTFTTHSDDGVRLYVDQKLVIDSWRPMRGYRSATLDLQGGKHKLRLIYFERSGIALVSLTRRKID